MTQHTESRKQGLEPDHRGTSVDHLAREALGLLRENAEPYTRSIDSAVRANPLAFALTGAGLAWLIFGGKSQQAPDTGTDGGYAYSTGSGGTYAAGSVYGRYEAGTGADGTDWSARIDALRRRASRMMTGLERGAEDYASQSGQILSELSSDMRDGFRHGLDDLSEEARERVSQARQAAYAARLRVERGAREGGRQVGHFVEDHPMVAGAIAMALGAAFAAALPRTRIEDRTFGEDSDRLMALAADRLREERARMARVAEGVADEVKSAARDAASAVAEGVEELAEGAKDRSEDEADKASSSSRQPDKGPGSGKGETPGSGHS